MHCERLLQLISTFGGSFYSHGDSRGAGHPRVNWILRGDLASRAAAALVPWSCVRRREMEIVAAFPTSSTEERAAFFNELQNSTSPLRPIHFSSWTQFGGFMDAKLNICVDPCLRPVIHSNFVKAGVVEAIQEFLSRSSLPAGISRCYSDVYRWTSRGSRIPHDLLEQILPHCVESREKIESLLAVGKSRESRIELRHKLFSLNKNGGKNKRMYDSDLGQFRQLTSLYSKRHRLKQKGLDTESVSEEIKTLRKILDQIKIRTEVQELKFSIREKFSEGAYLV